MMNTIIDCCHYCRYYQQSIYTWHQSAHLTPSTIYTPTPSTYSQTYPYSFPTTSINRNTNNNNNILDVQALYPSLPLNQFSTILTSNKSLTNVCHIPSSPSSLSSFDEPPPIKPRLSLRPQLPPPPPPPSFIPTYSSSTPQFRGPTRPAPKPPQQTQNVQQQNSYRAINNPFEKNFHQDDSISTRDSCDLETSSTRTDFFDLELRHLHNQLLIDDPTDKIDSNITSRRRQHVISELVSTERDYLRDLDLLIDTFLNPNSIVCPECVNKTLLFGNIREIDNLSRHLLNKLEIEFSKIQQNDDAHCCIGQIFNSLIDQFKMIYAEYCRNHEWVHGYLREHANDDKLQQYLQDGLCQLRQQKSTIFDVSALLLRPIQRIVRYPLILNELFKNTTNDHDDYLSLKDSISNLISMVNFINEFKRRKEIVSKYQRRDKDEALTNKLYKLNMHTMRKKSARISMRLSSVFGLTAHTIDERFNFEEQRFRALEKFLRIFVRNAYICMEGLKETFVIQVNVAEDFEEFVSDRMPELTQQLIRSKRLLLENAFTEFCTHMDSYVANPLNTLITLFILPSNLISKRHDKLLDYDSAQSAYEKSKDQQSRQSKQVLDLAKKTYEALNSQLLEELPILYESSCQILSICLKAFLIEHFRLFQQMNINIQNILHQTTSSPTSKQLSWLQIVERFNSKTSPTAEQLFQLTITAKNFSDKIKNFSSTRIAGLLANIYNTDKETNNQTDDIRKLLRNRYAEKDLFTVIRNFTNETNINVRSGDLVAVINQNLNTANWLVDTGVHRGLVPRSILIPISSSNQSTFRSHTPPTPLRNDIEMPVRTSLPIGFSQITATIDSERIYLNQIHETHQYASIDLEESISENEKIYIALYDFECTSEGVLSLQAGERLKILRHVDDGGNNDWWYVEKLNQSKQRGYVPANYIQAI